ncbi:MAG: hypothetical protein ABI590_02860 [Ilumatobacteraceae bacterium]
MTSNTPVSEVTEWEKSSRFVTLIELVLFTMLATEKAKLLIEI